MNGIEERPNASEEVVGGPPMKNFGASMNAISLGFVATAILISLFLITAILEHLLRHRTSLMRSRRNEHQDTMQLQSQFYLNRKLSDVKHELSCSSGDYTVVMPGQQNPTHLAHPAPLPCTREGPSWPLHDHLSRPHHHLPTHQHSIAC